MTYSIRHAAQHYTVRNRLTGALAGHFSHLYNAVCFCKANDPEYASEYEIRGEIIHRISYALEQYKKRHPEAA